MRVYSRERIQVRFSSSCSPVLCGWILFFRIFSVEAIRTRDQNRCRKCSENTKPKMICKGHIREKHEKAKEIDSCTATNIKNVSAHGIFLPNTRTHDKNCCEHSIQWHEPSLRNIRRLFHNKINHQGKR